MKLILSVRILINQTLHKPDSQTQHQVQLSSHCSCFSPSTCLCCLKKRKRKKSTCWSPCLLTPIQPWTSRSCPHQFWRRGQRNPARWDRPLARCCYLGQLCSLCSLLGYNLRKGKVKSLIKTRHCTTVQNLNVQVCIVWSSEQKFIQCIMKMKKNNEQLWKIMKKTMKYNEIWWEMMKSSEHRLKTLKNDEKLVRNDEKPKTSQELRMLSPSLFIQGSQCKC